MIVKPATARLLAMACIALAVPATAQAQVPPAQIGDRYVPAPWWMRDPVIASMGQVYTEVLANEASFEARFSTVRRTSAEAAEAAIQSIRDITKALQAFGAERVQVETNFETNPLYEQYRDKDGWLVDNERPDKINRYEVVAKLDIEVRDVSILERVYKTVLAAKPSGVGEVSFELTPTNEMQAWLYTEAVKDAARRARQAAEATGSRLGPVKIIDPTGRVCKTDVLAGWPSYGGSDLPTKVQPTQQNLQVQEMQVRNSSIVVTGAHAKPREDEQAALLAQAMQVALQPPYRQLSASACVVYALKEGAGQ